MEEVKQQYFTAHPTITDHDELITGLSGLGLGFAIIPAIGGSVVISKAPTRQTPTEFNSNFGGVNWTPWTTFPSTNPSLLDNLGGFATYTHITETAETG